ncbi:hypothetical protein ACEQ8H_003894 [Pleosporales sp. CAS-2024a]
MNARASLIILAGAAGGIRNGAMADSSNASSRDQGRRPLRVIGTYFIIWEATGHQRAVFERIKAENATFVGDFAFFNDWKLFWSSDDDLEQLTSTGPFSGTLGSFTTGVRLRTRYKHLLDKAAEQLHSSSHPIRFWASGSRRVIETARHFALGFFGLDYEPNHVASLEVISEHFSLGADTLTPGRTCLNNKRDEWEGQKKGYKFMRAYRAVYMPRIRTRLLRHTGMNFSDAEIYAMQEMCGFETTARGRSEWCHVFSQDEFLSFEYARDLLHYYRAGPGQKYAAAMGWLWLNATTNLLLDGGPRAGPLFFSFVHDGDIAPLMTALDILNDPFPLPVTHILHERRWRKSQIAPMGGRIIFELLSCHDAENAAPRPAKYVRLNINDGITAIPDCQSGPGRSCPLQQFAARTRKKGQESGNFGSLCGLEEGAAERITFLHQ